MGRSGLNIVYTSRCMQPCGETFDDRFRFIGPSFSVRAEGGDFDWTAVNNPVLIYISLGTLFNGDAGFYRKCLEAFRDVDCQAILSVGGNVAPEALGAPPPNVIVRSHVPQIEVLRRATVFITHGGMNSVSESLSCGVPMVLVPQMSEQELVSGRVADWVRAFA
jgi:MGT family glycosyltransferase